MKVLVVSPSWIGDTLMMQPLLTLLKQREPATHLSVLAPDWSAPLLGRMAEVDDVLSNPFAHGQFRWADRRTLGKQLAKAGYASCYVLPNSWKSALIPWFASIPQRIGYHGEARWGLLNRRHRLDKFAHPQLVQRYAALAGHLPDALPRPCLTSTLEQQLAARRALGLPDHGAPIVFCPGAEFGPAKRWPSRHFAELAQRLVASSRVGDGLGEKCAAVWIIGSPKDKDVGDEIVHLSNRAALNLCGKTTLEQAIDVIASARLVVSNDSGLMHVAAALDRPLVALYGSSDPGYTPPLSPDATVLNRRLECSPCFKRECPLGHFDCLTGLSPDSVLAAIDGKVVAQ